MKIIPHNLDEELAIKLLDWKWISYIGIPVKGTPGYPNHCRVRRLMSPELRSKPIWKKYLDENSGMEATGEEPLAYCYCSSKGSEPLPKFTIFVDSSHENSD